MKKNWPVIVVASFICIMAAMRIMFPERSLDAIGIRALWDAFFAISLLALTLLFSGALGWKILLWFNVDQITRLEMAIFSLAIGMGVLAYGIMALGLTGLLTTWMIFFWGICIGVWTINEWTRMLIQIPDWFGNQRNNLRLLGMGKAIVVLLALIILILELFLALAPPTGYDGLMYHLQGPLSFLKERRFILLPENWQANGPFTVEMLYTLGLSYGSDVFSQLVHLVYAVCLLLATFSFTRRFIGIREAWTAIAILLGIPLVPYLAAMPNVDYPWALYEFLALYALFLWKESQLEKWLILAGLCVGWAIGSKYFALGWAGILGIWVLWESRSVGIKKIFLAGLTFGIPGLMIGIPWYIKNFVLSGNPIYPFIFGGPGWDAPRLDFYMKYAQGFGAGRSFSDYLLLPIRLYTEREKFVSIGIEIPSLLFPFILLLPFTKKNAYIYIITWLTFFHFLLWAFSTQITRYLLPIFPALSVLTAYVMIQISDRIPWQQVRRLVLVVLLGSVFGVTLLISIISFLHSHPLPVALGLESKDAYLRRIDPSYSAQHFIKIVLPEQSKVLMMWDGKYYYCGERCLPDTDQSRWTRLYIEIGPNVARMAAKLYEMKITHLYHNVGDTQFVNSHDLTGWTQRSIDFFTNTYIPACGKEIYNDTWVQIFKFTCSE